MKIKLLNKQDLSKLQEYLADHKTECMFVGNNLKIADIEYKGADFQGEYFGCFNYNSLETSEQLNGFIVHYWNGNIMMHAVSKYSRNTNR